MKEKLENLLCRLREHSRLAALVAHVNRIERGMLLIMIVAAVLLFVFAVLADEVAEGDTRAFDERVLLALRAAGDPADPIGPRWFEEMMRDFTAIGGTGVLVLMVLAVAGFLTLTGKGHAALAIIVAVSGGTLLSQTGLAAVVGESLSDTLGVSSLLGVTIVIVIVAVIISETTSNTASAAIVVPIAISIAAANDLDPTIPALAAIFGANYGFMLPVSTPPNAIVYSSGMLPITRMIKAGAVFDVIGAVLCVIGVSVMANVVGLA